MWLHRVFLTIRLFDRARLYICHGIHRFIVACHCVAVEFWQSKVNGMMTLVIPNNTYIVGFLKLTALLLYQNGFSNSPRKYPVIQRSRDSFKLQIVFSFRSLSSSVVPLPLSFKAEALPPLVSLQPLLDLPPSAPCHVTLSTHKTVDRW